MHKRLFYKTRDRDDKQTALGVHLWAENVLISERGDVRLVSFEAAKKHEERHNRPGEQSCPEVVLMQLYRHSTGPADFLKLVGEKAVDHYFSS